MDQLHCLHLNTVIAVAVKTLPASGAVLLRYQHMPIVSMSLHRCNMDIGSTEATMESVLFGMLVGCETGTFLQNLRGLKGSLNLLSTSSIAGTVTAKQLLA